MSILRIGRILQFLALSFVASAVAQAALITVTPTIAQNGALFHYNYTITNGTGLDVPVLDITVQPGTGTILDLSAATGFLTAYDPILGLVSFLENTGTFGSTAQSGFAFDSTISPQATAFTATFADGTTASGATQGPVVPEPASLLLVAASGAALLFWRKSSQARSARI
jgi:hypothetical protein